MLVQGGTSNSRHLTDVWLDDAKDRGIHLISGDRPGCGGSTAQPGRSVEDCVNDVRAIAGALGIDRLAVCGYSGGGPHALACAALLPDLDKTTTWTACHGARSGFRRLSPLELRGAGVASRSWRNLKGRPFTTGTARTCWR